MKNNIFEIRELPKIFEQSSTDFGFEYYFDPEGKKIYLDYNIVDSSRYIFFYEISMEEGLFMLSVFNGVVVGSEISKIEKCFGPAGETEAEAIQFLIEKILERPKKNIGIKIDIEALRKSLEVVLLI